MVTPGGSPVRNLPANAGDTGSIRRSERPAGEGNSNPLQYSCLGNPMNRETWWATAHGVTKELDMTEQLNNNTTNSTHTHTHTIYCVTCNHAIIFCIYRMLNFRNRLILSYIMGKLWLRIIEIIFF